MATPIIAQVHGYCLAGGTELAAACDLLYVTPHATIGYPAIRTMSSPNPFEDAGAAITEPEEEDPFGSEPAAAPVARSRR